MGYVVFVVDDIVCNIVIFIIRKQSPKKRMIIIVINIMILVNITQTNHRFLNHMKVGDNSEIHLKF